MVKKLLTSKIFLNHTVISFYILSIGLLTTIFFTVFINFQINEREKTRFQHETERMKTTIENRMDTHIALLRAGAGLFSIKSDVTRDEFRTFTDRFGLQKKYPGIQGYGFTVKLEPYEKDYLVQQMHNEGFYDFQIYPENERDEYHAIVYLEPMDRRNMVALGYDMFTHEVRREAMIRAEETGKAAMSGKVTLVQEIDPDKQPGFLIYYPVYKTGTIPETVEERRKQILGFVYSPYRAGDLLSHMFGNSSRTNIQFTVYDGEKIREDALLYKSGKKDTSDPTAFTAQQTITVGGHTWTVQFESLPNFHSSDRNVIFYIFISGIAITLITYLLSRAQFMAQRRRSAILEGITDAFISLDNNWRITYINHEGTRILGARPENLLGSKLWNVLPDLKNTSFGKLYQRSMRDKKPRMIEGYYGPMKAWFLVRVYPSDFGLSLFFEDITQRKLLEKQKDDFVAIASHELKTPVTSIKGYTQVLLKKFSKEHDSRAVEFLTKLNAQVDRLTVLINDLLDVTKIESGEFKYNIKEFDFNELVLEVVDEMQYMAGNHTLVTKLGENKKVVGDRDRIGQVITNFVSNSIKFSPNGKQIIIRTVVDPKLITLSVQDFGIGIPKKEQRDIFKRFRRASSAKTESYPGLGLGLYISSEIIKRHGGKIWVESEEGKGSIFSFSLPLNSSSEIQKRK